MRHRISNWYTIGCFLTLVGLLASACAPAATGTTPAPGPTTQAQTAEPSPLPTGTPAPTTLTICQDAEPETLYLYGGSATARHVLEAVYDGPIDRRSYAFQPVILESLPSLENGDAYFETVTVQAGDTVVDATGQPTTLAEGVQVLATHTCLDGMNPDCVTTFTGTPIEMEQMVVYWQMREGIVWSDGEPVTADDSVYSYELACDPDTPYAAPDTPTGKDLCERTASYVAAGERSVTWTGIPGDVDDLYALHFFSPLPRHLWQEQLHYTATDLLNAPESTQTPLGWGPFVITGWVQGDSITMERNPLYFRASEGLPRADTVIFRFAPSTDELVAMLLSGACDVGLVQVGPSQGALATGELALSIKLSNLMPFLVAAQEDGLLQLVTSSSEIWEHVAFGIVPTPAYDRPDFFGDERTRQAIAQCIDRQTIVDEVTFGLGNVANSYLPPEHPLYGGARLNRWDYNPESGQALLAEVGWQDEDSDGIVEAHDVAGVLRNTLFQINLLVVQGDAQQEAIARIVRANLAECGIQATLVYTPTWDFFANGPTGPVFGRQFDMALFAWRNDVEPPCDLYLSEQIPNQDNWDLSNATGFSNEPYDAACRAALAALSGSREYDQFHNEAQVIFSQQLPDLPLFWWVRVVVTRPGVTGLTLDSSDESPLWGIEEISR